MKTPLNRFLFLLLAFASTLESTNTFAQSDQRSQANETEQIEEQPEEQRTTIPENTASTAPDLNAQKQILLSNELESESLVWLQSNQEKFIALWEPDSSGTPFGAVLLLHGEGQTADWPNSIRALRSSLPLFGWATLSLSLSDPPATGANDNAIEKQVASRIDAAMAFLNEQGQFNIALLGDGLGATRALDYAKGNESGDRNAISALVMVNVRNTQPASEKKLLELMRDYAPPLLDIYYGDHFLDETEAQARKLAAKKYRLQRYHQIKLLEPSSDPQKGENRLSRRVRGFLNKYAKGVEIDT